jgi:hypothetical protein
MLCIDTISLKSTIWELIKKKVKYKRDKSLLNYECSCCPQKKNQKQRNYLEEQQLMATSLKSGKKIRLRFCWLAIKLRQKSVLTMVASALCEGRGPYNAAKPQKEGMQ